MQASKKWIIPRNSSGKIDKLAAELRISPITAQMLLNRGIENREKAREFLEPTLHQLSDPSRDDQVKKAAFFLKERIKEGKKITVYGDFDADGICASALMVRALRAGDASVDFYVPHRFDEGYGLNFSAVEELKNNGTDVILTVDCGISAIKEIQYAKELGLDIIITDHHQQRGERPTADFILNPHLRECEFGYENLSGVGVAFKLAWSLGQAFGAGGAVSPDFKETLVDLLPLVAIGTVADLVPMENENRVYVNYGLKLLPSAKLAGIRALLQVCGIAGKSRYSTYNIGYQIAPRLNAVGRMADACAAIDMLTTDDFNKAREIAGELEAHNRKRQITQRAISAEAMELAESTHDLAKCNCIVLSHPEWHPGVVGLVASKLAEHFSRPAFVFYEKDGIACGSARSIPGLHLFKAISKCGDLLDRFGGHKGAAGMSLPLKNLEPFKQDISDITSSMLGPEPPMPQLQLEGELELRNLSEPAVEELSYLEPYGEGNPQPLFAARGLKIAGNPQTIGSRRNHLAFFAKQNGISLRVIAFGKAEWLKSLKARQGQSFSLAFEPRINTFNRKYEVELRAEDIQWDGGDLIEYVDNG